MARSEAEKEKIETISQELISLTGEFCDEYLDDEYKQLSEKLILKMKRKRQVPFLLGSANTWAAGVIYALGQINFLFDSDAEPHAAPSDIAEHFGVAKSTVGQKAKKIRDMCGLRYWAPEFSTQVMQDQNPFKRMSMVNGFLIIQSPEDDDIYGETPTS